MPVELQQPGTGGPILVYAGDPLPIEITIQGQDLTSSLISASIRRRPQDSTELLAFDVSTQLVGSDTIITLLLSGDSAPNAMDGQTRKIVSTANFDVQESDISGQVIRTLVTGQLKHVEDVTR